MSENDTTHGPHEAEAAPGGIPTVDGAVREMEKSAIATEQGAGVTQVGVDAGDPGGVIPLGKERGGAPEDAAPEHDGA